MDKGKSSFGSYLTRLLRWRVLYITMIGTWSEIILDILLSKFLIVLTSAMWVKQVSLPHVGGLQLITWQLEKNTKSDQLSSESQSSFRPVGSQLGCRILSNFGLELKYQLFLGPEFANVWSVIYTLGFAGTWVSSLLCYPEDPVHICCSHFLFKLLLALSFWRTRALLHHALSVLFLPPRSDFHGVWQGWMCEVLFTPCFVSL